MIDRTFLVPERVATHFHIRPGDRVGDFGAGAGAFSAVLSKLVGPQGRVYACEIQKALVEKLTDQIRRDRLGNVEVIWGDLEEAQGTKIKDGTLDAAIIVNTLFQIEDRQTAIGEMARTLRAGGKLFIIDWAESWGGIGPEPAQVLDESEARALGEGAALSFERSFDAGGHHYGLAFRK